MPAGTPRTVSFPPDKMIELGIEMVEWVTENKPLHLSAFYTIHKGFLHSEWETMVDRKEFIPYYEKALRIVGLQYLDKTSNVREGISQRWQRVYFKDLEKQEDKDADKEAERKKASDNYVSPIQELNDLMHQNMLLQAKLASLEEKNANKSKTE